MTPKQPSIMAVVSSLLLLTFVAGASAGVIGERLTAGTPSPRIRETVRDMSAVLDRLALTPEQRVRAEAIVARTAPRTREIMMEAAEQLRLVADSLDRELRTILTAEQGMRLDSLPRATRLMLKRKTVTPVGTAVDTLLDTGVAGQRVR